MARDERSRRAPRSRKAYRERDDLPEEELPNRPAGGSLRDNTYSVRPSTSRHAFDPDRDEVSFVEPTRESTESQRQYARRRESNDLAYRKRKVAKKRKAVLIVIGVLLSCLIAFLVGYYVYMGQLDARLQNSLDDEVKTELSAHVDETEPVYFLLVGKTSAATEASDRLSLMMLVRYDPEGDTVTFISIPAQTRVRTDQGDWRYLTDFYDTGGRVAFVHKIKDLLDVDINHYIEFETSEVTSLVDVLGGVDATVPDNTIYNGVSIPAGSYTLNGDETYVLMNCRKVYTDGDFTRIANQQAIVESLVESLDDLGSFGRVQARTALADCIATDLTLDDVDDMARDIAGAGSDLTVYFATIPTSSRTVEGQTYEVLKRDDWTQMRALFEAGDDPSQISDGGVASTDVIMPQEYEVSVRNGSGVVGCAQQAADRLTAAGYVVIETGNANSFVYDETLVVYDSDEMANVAQDVVDKLGVGRTVQNPGSYTFDGDILVMVGGDWVP